MSSLLLMLMAKSSLFVAQKDIERGESERSSGVEI